MAVAFITALCRSFERETMLDPGTTKEFVRTLIGGIMWTPYMLISKEAAAPAEEDVVSEARHDCSANRYKAALRLSILMSGERLLDAYGVIPVLHPEQR
ncbi:hypothetical protein [Kineobactrum salinum]|uniref:Uncharacterized protein n=1 Tax=Kineobactrum salinum TaxID=2708301 RepID=A0A6C0U1E3_9GAMM|nr:hypothetical protein [Kineobactrum salinum]QIB65718.1 hypothetical protein G3T16_10115 [Kineobactrum salinum]